MMRTILLLAAIAAMFWLQYRTAAALLAVVTAPRPPAWDVFTPDPWQELRGI
jgi:hypothetical protein